MAEHVPFFGARAKLTRAANLTRELDTIIRSYSGAKLVAKDMSDRRMEWRVAISSEIPDEIPGILGDAIHNLRSSLDHLAVSLVVMNKGNPKSVHFPFSENAEQLDHMIKQRNFHRASVEAKELLKIIRPYKGGNTALRGLHDLDILDKHNDMLPVYNGATVNAIFRVGGAVIRSPSTDMRDNAHVITHPGSGAILQKPLPISLVAKFPLESPFPRNEVVPTLASLAQLVGGIIQSFAALYGR